MVDWSDRFWSKVAPEALSGCWLWHGAVNPRGYGSFGLNGRTVLAHRHAYELTTGPIPTGLFLLHRCDVPACVNPDHLHVGTHAENMTEMTSRGRSGVGDRNSSRRHPRSRPRGERVGTAKLSAVEVEEIRELRGVSQREIARRYGVDQSTVHHVVSGKTWKAA